jgi:cathepsin X
MNMYAYEWAAEFGFNDETCNAYIAHNLESNKCYPKNLCYDCEGPMPRKGENLFDKKCHAANYQKFYVSDRYLFCNNPYKMMAEVYVNGPISCNMC